MKVQSSKISTSSVESFKVQKCGRSILIIFLFTVCCLLSAAAASEKWSGVDTAVVEKIAKEQGREAHAPLINTDQGDLLLFAFLIAGAAGGFAAGYYWRNLTSGKKDGDGKDMKE